MSIELIRQPLPGESMVAIEPELLQTVDPGWRHRMSLYTGRALTDLALTAEQGYRSGRIALLSQLVTRGIANGLEAAVTSAGNVRVNPGYGFTAQGEDVTLARQLQTTLDALLVVDGVTGADVKSLPDLKKDAGVKGGAYVLLLQPVTGKVTGSAINTGAPSVEVCGDLSCSCTRDPEGYAFEDWELVDGARLVLARWPDLPASLKLPDGNPAATFRNRLASTIFGAEMALGPDEFLPWESLGVALGVLSFAADWTIQFFDRSMVVRGGGRARNLQLLSAKVSDAGDFRLIAQSAVEARLLQLLEQNAQIANQKDFTAYVTLPPTAIVPAAAVDLINHKNGWFPQDWKLHLAPIHAEEVETALRSQLFAAPFDLTHAEEAALLLPLSDDVYDPNVLVVESLAQIFKDELKKAVDGRNGVLQHRKFLQIEANALLKAANQSAVDLDAGLTADEKQGRDLAAYKPAANTPEDYGTVVKSGATISADVDNLRQAASAAPYTVTIKGKTVPLVSDDDWKFLDANGLQAFLDRIDARVDKADDLINVHYLQTQTNIYRFRTNVLDANAVSRLVTSPIIANIAQRETAVATAQDLQSYLNALPKQPPPAPAPAPPPAPAPIAPRGINLLRVARTPAISLRGIGGIGTVGGIGAGGITPLPSGPTPPAATAGARAAIPLSPIRAISLNPVQAATQAVNDLPSKSELPSPSDVTAQLPLAGVPFNLRTLSIAERLKPSPSHESLLYSASSRIDLLEQLLAADLGLTVDDLELLVQEADPQNPGKFVLARHTIAELRDATAKGKIYDSIQKGGLPDNSDEPSVFSAGISALDHHALLLRAVEARVALYRQFLALGAQAVASMQGNLDKISGALKQLANDLSDARHNLAFVQAIVNDENNRIAGVNARRRQILQNVPFLVLMRPRTLETDADVPSRQLVPAYVQSPVPAALAANVIVPPELRELAGLLREAPLAWIPATEKLLASLERPQHFVDVAVHMQVRAYTKLQVPQAQSSAQSHPGPYGAPIADIFASQQTALTTMVQQRAGYQATKLVSMSWAEQRQELFQISAINDLIAAEAVHLEIARQVAQLIEDISKVATALYVRVSATLPADRLQWAEFLRGPGRSMSLRSLTVLPQWTTQEYVDRQQMQMLVDWLFGQIDLNMAAAVSYVSDLVRTAILLASHAPVSDIIEGEVAARTRPAVGGLVPLTSGSERVARGMPVLLYQAGTLTARAVVHDLDSQQVYAKVTTVYQADTYLDESAQAHFLNQDTQDAVLTKASLRLR